ncbi:hypothetical protein PFISCL1PPCAC_9309, partial [Pristionchus fissidentatus]
AAAAAAAAAIFSSSLWIFCWSSSLSFSHSSFSIACSFLSSLISISVIADCRLSMSTGTVEVAEMGSTSSNASSSIGELLWEE